MPGAAESGCALTASEEFSLDKRREQADNEGMRHVPTSLKLLAALSLLAEATAAALVFWHTGPRARQ